MGKLQENFINTTTVAPSTVNIYLNAVAAFLNWASDEDNNYISPKKYIKKYKQKVVKKIKPPYTVEEYEQLLSFFQNNKNTEMFLLLQFLWHTGARVGETLSIRLSDIKLEKKCIFVPNKIYKGEQEALLLIPEAIKIVEQVSELASQRGDDKLFSWKSGQLPNLMAVRAEEKLNIKIHDRGLHGIRRAFCDRLFEKGLSIPEVQDIMRHRDIQTTINYYRSFKQQELVNKMSEKLKN